MGNALTTECPKQECSNRECPTCPVQKQCPKSDNTELTKERNNIKILEENLAKANQLIKEKDKLIEQANKGSGDCKTQIDNANRIGQQHLDNFNKCAADRDNANNIGKQHLDNFNKCIAERDNANKIGQDHLTNFNNCIAERDNANRVGQGHLDNLNKCVGERDHFRGLVDGANKERDNSRAEMQKAQQERDKVKSDMANMVRDIGDKNRGHKLPTTLLKTSTLPLPTGEKICGPEHNKVCGVGEYCNVHGHCGNTDAHKTSPNYQYRICTLEENKIASELGCQENPCSVM